MASKRYAELLERLTRIREMPVGQARRVFADLLAASFGDVVELGIQIEDQQWLKERRKPTPWQATGEEIVRLQSEIYDRLREDTVLQDRRRNRRKVGQGITLYSAMLSTPADRLRIEVHGPVNELLAMQAYALARVVGIDRLKICDCEKLFVRIGKREHCSKRCQKRVYMRRFRAGEVGEEEK